MTVTRNGTMDQEIALSPRELQVLALVAQGLSTREIAEALWVTQETVKSHVSRVLHRLHARTRAQAVAIAYRDGLWPNPDSDGRGPAG